MNTTKQIMRELISTVNSMKRVVLWHEKRILELTAEQMIDDEQFIEFVALFTSGHTKEEIADTLQIDPTLIDGLEEWGKLDW